MGVLCVLEVEPVEARLLVERGMRGILQIIFVGWADAVVRHRRREDGLEVDVEIFEGVGRWAVGTVFGS